MTRARGVNWAALHATGSIEGDSADWYPMNDPTDSPAATGGFDGNVRGQATWTGGHTRTAALCAFDDVPASHGDEVYSQSVNGGSYLTFTPNSSSYQSANPWWWCFIQPDSDVGDAFIIGRDGIMRVEFDGTDVVATATLTDASTISATADYGTITEAHMIAVSFIDSDKKVRIYIDGVLVATSAAGSAGVVQSSTAPYRYGGGPAETNFRGDLDMWAYHFAASVMTDTKVWRMWLQLKGWTFPYLDTFGQSVDGTVPDEFDQATGSPSTPAASDGALGLGGSLSGDDAGLAFAFRSLQVYYETAVWGGGALFAGLNYDANMFGSPSTYDLVVDNTASLIRFTTGGGATITKTFAELGVDAPITRSRALRIGLHMTHVHAAGTDNIRAQATAYVNGVSIGTHSVAAYIDRWYPINFRNHSSRTGANFEYFYMDTTPSTPEKDYIDWAVGTVTF